MVFRKEEISRELASISYIANSVMDAAAATF
jgi:hypothetical protein